MKRLGVPRDVPFAVQQWQGLIAVNYPARAAGITRHMRVPEALKACPALRLAHVETIGGARARSPPCHRISGSISSRQQRRTLKAAASLRAQRPPADAAAHRAPPPSPPPALPAGDGSRNDGGDAAAANRTRGTAKACLQRYRIASAEVMALLAELAPGATLEKASIDEAYLVR